MTTTTSTATAITNADTGLAREVSRTRGQGRLRSVATASVKRGGAEECLPPGEKGSGKGKPLDAVPYEDKLNLKTADGKPICKRWNHPRAKCDFGVGCRFLHVCQICFGKHQASQCDKRND